MGRSGWQPGAVGLLDRHMATDREWITSRHTSWLGLRYRPMTPNDAEAAICDRVRVTRADIAAAKSYLMLRMTDQVSIDAEADEYARIAAPGAPLVLLVSSVDDSVSESIMQIGRHVSAKLAIGAAAWELVLSGEAFVFGVAKREVIGWQWTDGRNSAGFSFGARVIFAYPAVIGRPTWYPRADTVFDADLYLLRLSPLALLPSVAQALREALMCFRHDLYLPCAAMVGAASEAAWVETGLALAGRFRGTSVFDKLASTLRTSDESTRRKIARICDAYELPMCHAIRERSEVTTPRVRQVQRWSDHVREARNVLHWGAAPTIPNTYEKTAVLLMDAVSELTVLHAVRDACAV